MSCEDAGPIIPVPWDRLRAWIDEQEALEKRLQNQQVAAPSMSRLQMQALSVLIPLVDDEPQLDNTDWVSKLMCLIQSRRLSPPVFQDLDPLEIPVGGAFGLRWRTICYLPHLTNIGQFLNGFPSLGFGVEDEEKGIPMFKSKKLAKQYAAKHAHAFLQGTPPSEFSQGKRHQPSMSAQASPSPGGGGASLLKSPMSQTTATSSSSLSSGREGAFSLAAAGTPGSAPPASDGDDPVSKHPGLVTSPRSPGSPHVFTSNFDMSNGDFSTDSGPSVLARLSTLAGHLGLGSPNFEVEEDIGQPGFFTGRAVFRSTAPVPPGLGTVTGVLGKKNAKLESAARVLQWLEKEEKRRRSIHEDLLKDL